MNIQELRIGNFLQLSPESMIYQVRGIREEYDEEFSDSNGVISLEEIHGYENFGKFSQFVSGIPITEEWLLKAGFKKHKAASIGCQDMWAGMKGWSYREIDEWLFRGNADRLHLAGYFNTQIQYLHQLQNLIYSLTGEELTFNL